MNQRLRHLVSLLWPAFVGAGVVQALVFAQVDPESLHGLTDGPLKLTPLAVQSLAFLAFWAILACSAAVTRLLDRET